MKFHDVRQNTDEWQALRLPRITSSNMAKVMANYGKAFGDPAKKYAVDIAVAQLGGNLQGSGYSNDHMARGHAEEPLAIMAYEQEYFCDVSNGGFFEVGDLGTSPDGLVGSVGGVEIKSAIPSVHFERIQKASYDSAYKWQICSHLKITGREWFDFVSYCSAFPEGKKLYVFRCYRGMFEKEFEMMDQRIEEFRVLIEDAKKVILNNEYSVIDARKIAA